MVGLDDSPLHRQVLQRSFALAKMSGAKLNLAYFLSADVLAIEPGRVGQSGITSPMVSPVSTIEYKSVLDQQQANAEAQLQQDCAEAQSQGVTAEYTCEISAPSQGICDLAKRWSADLIIVGRRGRRGISEILLGSVSNYVVHHAPCAVLVVQPDHKPAKAASQPADSSSEPQSEQSSESSFG